jgi:hypothetical protein
MGQLLLKKLQNSVDISNNQIDMLNSYLQKCDIKKGQTILAPNQPEITLRFIIKGIIILKTTQMLSTII